MEGSLHCNLLVQQLVAGAALREAVVWTPPGMCCGICIVCLSSMAAAGGELLDAVLEKGHYSEADARSCFLQIMRAIQYLHSR